MAQFDPRFVTVEEIRPLGAYPALAMSDTILQQLLSEIEPASQRPDSLAELREILKVSAADDPSLFRLSVRHRQAAAAARIANRWAELFVRHANVILGDQGGGQADSYREQRDAAQRRRDIQRLGQ